MRISKWRETIINPETIKFKSNLVIDKILGYPYAGNDVFECVGKLNNKKKYFYLKVQRSDMYDVLNESEILSSIKENKLPIPQVIESGVYNNLNYIVTKKINGNKLSTILEKIENKSEESIKYMKEYGRFLAYIHNVKIKCSKAKQRKINDIPENNSYSELASIIQWLKENKPKKDYKTFIHGDFHYANILWKKYKISGILDWEYSGLGFKEQDIAWSLILRSSQNFLTTLEEIEEFLNGYKEIGSYNKEKLYWCLVNGYTHFYIMNKKKDINYCKILLDMINYFINKDVK